MEYNANGGKIAFSSSSVRWDNLILTDANGWYSNPNYVGGYDHPGTPPGGNASVSVTSAGSPKIRLRWSGSGSPPSVAWLLVDSTALWTSTNGSGSADNGFGDRPVVIANGRQKSGKHLIRLTGGTTREWSKAVSATATINPTASSIQNGAAQIEIIGSVTDKNASLERVGGGDVTIESNFYTGNTLLSWTNGDGFNPGPNYQTLKGSYGGTWSKKPDGTNNVTVAWSGASTGGYSPTPSNLTPSNYAPSPGGLMPYADASISPKTQSWNYSVHDNGDGTDVQLVFQWICHYAYESFIPYPPELGGGTSRDAQSEYTIPLGAGASGSVAIPAGSMPAKTDYEESHPTYISNLPHADKYVGIPAYRARAGRTTPNSWSASTYPVSATIAGDYGYGYYRTWQGHLGNVLAWNAAGVPAIQPFSYFLDNESDLMGQPITPQGSM